MVFTIKKALTQRKKSAACRSDWYYSDSSSLQERRDPTRAGVSRWPKSGCEWVWVERCQVAKSPPSASVSTDA